MSATTIWKYTFDVREPFEVEVPASTTWLPVVMVSDDGTKVSMWGMHYLDDTAKRTVIFEVAGTGYHLNGDLTKKYIGTGWNAEHTLVWHLFEVKKP